MSYLTATSISETAMQQEQNSAEIPGTEKQEEDSAEIPGTGKQEEDSAEISGTGKQEGDNAGLPGTGYFTAQDMCRGDYFHEFYIIRRKRILNGRSPGTGGASRWKA